MGQVARGSEDGEGMSCTEEDKQRDHVTDINTPNIKDNETKHRGGSECVN